MTGWQCVPTSCSNAPQQPAASGCTTGTWNPIYSGQSTATVTTNTTVNGCIIGWQCVAGTSSTNPQASLSCSPSVGDVGSSITLGFQCVNSANSTGSGFSTSNLMSGTTSVILATPPVGTNTATYSLTCGNSDNSITAGAQCSVQVGTPKIVLVANPTTVPSGASSSIGWITSGMQSCTIASPELPDFTAQNANDTAVIGVVQTTPIATSSDFVLTRTTLGGNTGIIRLTYHSI